MNTLHRTNLRSPTEFSSYDDFDQVGVDATPSLTAEDLRHLAAELIELPPSYSAIDESPDEASRPMWRRLAIM